MIYFTLTHWWREKKGKRRTKKLLSSILGQATMLSVPFQNFSKWKLMVESPWKWSYHGNQAFISYLPAEVTKQSAMDVMKTMNSVQKTHHKQQKKKVPKAYLFLFSTLTSSTVYSGTAILSCNAAALFQSARKRVQLNLCFQDTWELG